MFLKIAREAALLVGALLVGAVAGSTVHHAHNHPGETPVAVTSCR